MTELYRLIDAVMKDRKTRKLIAEARDHFVNEYDLPDDEDLRKDIAYGLGRAISKAFQRKQRNER